MTKLQNKNLHALYKVLLYIKTNNIIRIHGRGVLDRFIELAKFPETKHLVNHSYFKKLVRNNKGTAYKNQQYDPLRNFMIHHGYISVDKTLGRKYQYSVQNKINHLDWNTLLNENN